MNVEQMTTAVQAVIHNSDYTDEIVLGYINEAILAIATGVIIPGRRDISPPLPDLYAVDTVTTKAGVGKVELPYDYNRDVVMVLDPSGNKLKKVLSWRDFARKYYDEKAGDVSLYCVRGNTLYFRDIPSSPTVLTIHYHQVPYELTMDSDTCYVIPEPLHRDLIVGHVCKTIFNILELGMVGPKVDTDNYENIFAGGILKLIDIFPADDDPDYHDDTTEYCP